MINFASVKLEPAVFVLSQQQIRARCSERVYVRVYASRSINGVVGFSLAGTMPRVVPDQKTKYETDDLFKKLSQEMEVKFKRPCK